jgi:membrane-associated phospholipid phosphatase
MIAALIVTALGLAVFVPETAGVSSAPGPTRLDLRILDAADDLNSGAGVATAKVVTIFGTLPITAAVAIIAAIVLVRAGRAAEAATLVGSVVAIYVAVHVTKAATDRPRPPNPLADTTLSAFPSGHAAYSTIYVAVALATRRMALVVLATLLALAIGATRVYLRVHWLDDVLAGWALGAAIFGAATAVAVAVGRFRNNDPRTVPWP